MSPQSCPLRGGNLGEFALITGAAWVLALPAGVTIAGNLAGGDGGFGWSLALASGGMAAGLPLAALLAGASGSGTRTARYVGAGLVALALPLVGAIVGYEFSVSPPERRRASRPRVLPAFEASATAAAGGLTVVF